MSGTSSIEWTDKTWNPVRGCAIVSPGCTNCYAMKFAHRFSGAGQAYEGLIMMTKGGPVWTGKMRLVDNELHTPHHWKKPSRIFVNSMSDLFHHDVPDEFIAKVWFVMASNQQHVFQILTKRPERMLEWVSRHGQNAVFAGEREEHDAALKKHDWPLRNVWLGVSVEDQVRLEVRVPLLLKTPAVVRWISAEPLLGPLSFEGLWVDHQNPAIHENWLEALDWVVAGGESGRGARPMHPHWIRELRDQCAAVGTPFFFKQWGAWAPVGPIYADEDTDEHLAALECLPDGERERHIDRHGILQDGGHQPPDGTWALRRVGKKSAGRMLDGRTHDEYPA